MDAKTPVVLLVLVETARLRWFVASLGLDGRATPLLRSEVGDLDKYLSLPFDEQVSFVVNRLLDRFGHLELSPPELVCRMAAGKCSSGSEE